MNITEMKEKIVNEINKLDDEKALYEILHALNGKHEEAYSIDATTYQDKLFQKHDGLLKRLS